MNKMDIFKKNTKHNDEELLKSGSIFLTGAIAVAIINYVYHLSMGRMLGPEDYGVLGSLFALIYIALFATTAFNLTISKFSAEFNGKNKNEELKLLIRTSLKRVIIIGLIILLIYFMTIPFIRKFMHLDGISGLVIVGLIAYVSILSSILSGALNGLHKFVWQNISSFSTAFIKLVCALLFVLIGFKVNGALFGLLIGTCVGVLVSGIPLKSVLWKNKSKKALNNKQIKKEDLKKIYIYLFFVLLSSVISILIITFDQVLVKHYFSSVDAGFYAAAGMIAKVIWFGSAGFLAGPLFPKIVSLSAKGKNTSNILRKALLYTILLSFGLVLIYYLIPGFIVSLLYGKAYSSISYIIPLFGFSMALFSINQIITSYNLAKENYSSIGIIFTGFIIEVIGIYFFHNTLLEVVYVFFFINFLTVLSLLFYNRKEVFNLK